MRGGLPRRRSRSRAEEDDLALDEVAEAGARAAEGGGRSDFGRLRSKAVLRLWAVSLRSSRSWISRVIERKPDSRADLPVTHNKLRKGGMN